MKNLSRHNPLLRVILSIMVLSLSAQENVLSRREHDQTLSAKRVEIVGAFSSPVGTDAVTAEYPSSSVEVYKFRTGGVGGSILMTITVTYTDSTKQDLVSAVKT